MPADHWITGSVSVTGIQVPPIDAPTGIAKKYLRYLLGFGVWFVIGLAPFLGKAKVPGFSALIELYPASLQDWLIPLSGMFMGMMAVTVQFAASQRTSAVRIRRRFGITVAVFAASFLLLACTYIFTVTRVGRAAALGTSDAPAFTTMAVITGSRTVPKQAEGSECTCLERQPAARCVVNISLNPDNIDTCFGSDRVAFATLGLVLLYLGVTGSFAAAVGLLVISERASSRRR
jgi:hypothetical protein